MSRKKFSFFFFLGRGLGYTLSFVAFSMHPIGALARFLFISILLTCFLVLMEGTLSTRRALAFAHSTRWTRVACHDHDDDALECPIFLYSRLSSLRSPQQCRVPCRVLHQAPVASQSHTIHCVVISSTQHDDDIQQHMDPTSVLATISLPPPPAQAPLAYHSLFSPPQSVSSSHVPNSLTIGPLPSHHVWSVPVAPTLQRPPIPRQRPPLSLFVPHPHVHIPALLLHLLHPLHPHHDPNVESPFWLIVDRPPDDSPHIGPLFFNALQSGAIPIYFGSSNASFFAPTPSSFVDGSSFLDADDLLRHVLYIYENTWDASVSWHRDVTIINPVYSSLHTASVETSTCRLCMEVAKHLRQKKISAT